MSRIRRSVLIVSAIFCGCILLFIPASLFIFGTQPGQSFVQKKISTLIPGTIEWENLELSFTKTFLNISDIRLYTPDHQQVFSAHRVFADVDFSHVFKKELVFRAIEIDALKLDAKTGKNGKLNIVQALVDSAEPEADNTVPFLLPFNIRAKKIKIIDGRIHLFLSEQKVQATSGRLDVLVSDVDIQKKQGRLVLDLSDTALQISQIHQILDHLKLEMNMEDSDLKILKGNLIFGDSRLAVSGKILDVFETPGLNMLINAKIFANQIARKFYPELQINGLVDADIKITGPIDRPQFLLEANADSLSAFEHTMSVNLSGGIKDQSVFVSDFQARAKTSIAKGHGNYNLLTTDFDTQIFVSAKNINDFTAIFGFPSTGGLFVEGKVWGNLDQPRADFQIKAENIAIQGTQINLVTGTVKLAAETGNFKGHLDLNATGITGEKWQINTIDMALTGNGAIKDPHIQGRLDMQGMMLGKENLAPLKLKLEGDKNTITAKGSFGFDVAGSYQIPSQAFDAKMWLDSVQLAPYFKMAGQEEFSGSLKGVITASGSVENLQEISASASLSDLVVVFRDKESIRADTILLSFDQGKLKLPETKILLFEKAFATISGQGQLPDTVSVQFDTDFPVELIDPVFEQIDQATGRVVVNAQLKGSITKPDITGQIQLINIGMALSLIDNSFKQINGKITLNQDRIIVDQITGFLGDGDFLAKGQVTLSGMDFESGQMDLQAHRLPLNFPDLMDLTLNSRLSLTGNLEKSRLSGDIVLLEGRYYKDVKLDIIKIPQKKRTLQPGAKHTPSFMDTMVLDIGVTRQEPFLVENNLATLYISPDLRIAGVASHPLLNGRAQVDSGVVKFQKKEFEVEKGVIDFVSPYRIEPVIDLEASVDVRTWTITMAVSGPPENLDFTFRSNPPEQHADIVSLLAFGKTTRELRTSQGGSDFSPAQILSGFVADTAQKNLKDITGLDYVELGVTGDGNTERYGANVIVGKELSEQLAVKYGVDARSGAIVQRVTTDYKILENLLMSGYQDSAGDFGGALKYRLEFR